MSSRSGITKCAVHSYFILLLIAIAAGAALIIVMAVLGFVGFGSSQVTIVTCTGYFQTKYGNLANFATISFLSTIIGTTILTVLMVLMLCWVIQLCKGPANKQDQTGYLLSQYQPYFIFTRLLYCLNSFAGVCAVVPVGYYFSFFVEFVTSGCAFTYTTGYIVIILIISALWLALTLLAWVAAIYINYKYVQQEDTVALKYREVADRTIQTLENEGYIVPIPEKRVEKYEIPIQANPQPKRDLIKSIYQQKNAPSRLYPPPQAIYESPIDKEYTYSKSPIIITPKAQPDPALGASRKSYVDEQANSNVRRRNADNPSFFKNPTYLSPRTDNPSDLMFERKPDRRPSPPDEDILRRQQSRYLSQFGQGGIIQTKTDERHSPNRSGVQRRDRGYGVARDNGDTKIHDGYFQTPVRKISPAKDRDGMLINFIRGKYAN